MHHHCIVAWASPPPAAANLNMPSITAFSKWIALAGFSFATASAQTLTLTLNNLVPWVPVSGNAGSSKFSNTPAGVLNFSVTAQSENMPPFASTLALFCVELQQRIQRGSTGNVYSVAAVEQASSGINAGHSANIPLGGIGADRARNLEVLYAHVFNTNYNPAALTDVQKSAFQLAVWELSHDDGFTITSGHGTQFWVTSTGPSVTQAQSWVDWVAANYTTAPVMELSSLHNSQKQDFLIPNYAFSPIPEPSTYALLASVAILAFVLGRGNRPQAC